MTDPIQPNPLSTQPGAVATGAPADSATPRPALHEGPSFRALLERLQERAAGLQAASQDVAGGGNLAGAVDQARASLEDALSLSDKLLEAYRASRHNATVSDDSTSDDGGAA